MKRIKYSLNFKILVGIIALLLACTSFNLIYSYRIFINDKTSYIFETGLKRSESLINQFDFNISKITNNSQLIYFLSTQSNFDLQKFINTEKSSVLLGKAKKESQGIKYDSIFVNEVLASKIKSKYDLTIDDLKGELEKKLTNYNSLKYNDIEFIHNAKGGDFILSLYKEEYSDQILFHFVDISDLITTLESDTTFSHKLVLLKDPKQRDPSAIEWLSQLSYDSIRKGTKEINVQGVSKLVSYAKSLDSKYLIASFIDREKAFGITQFLIVKTILFACTLLGIAIAIGIYFAATITHPIKVLTEKTQNVADGDFSGTVNIQTTDELSILGNTFNIMNNEIRTLLLAKEEMIKQLEEYSKNLERMVEQRTIELKNANDFMNAMVNSLDQGLLVFDNELQCNDIFTKACVPIFGASPSGKTFLEILQIVDDSERTSLVQWAKILFSEMIPFESAVDLGPNKKVNGVNFQSPDFKHVQLNYYPIRDDEEKMKNVVVVATDKTNEIQAIEKAKENEKYVSMILKILKNKTQFQSFCQEVEDIMKQFSSLYNLDNNTIHFEQAMILFHTLNGGFGMFSIYKLQKMSKDLETKISLEKKNDNNLDNRSNFLEEFIKDMKIIREEFEDFKVYIDQTLGTKITSGDTTLEVSKEKINEFKELVDSVGNHDITKVYYENFIKEPVINYFNAYDDLCKSAAAKSGKKFNGLIFHNENLKIIPTQFKEFFNVLVHLFRNCIDHGIETPSVRTELNKSEIGQIDVSFDLVQSGDNNFLMLVIQDDGAGIDPEIIRNRFSKLNPEIDVTNISEKQIIYKIFDPFFTTKDEVSSLSGRGVGMSAIKEVVDTLNGQIEIETHIGKGTTFSFFIPYSLNYN